MVIGSLRHLAGDRVLTEEEGEKGPHSGLVHRMGGHSLKKNPSVCLCVCLYVCV